MEGLTAGRIVHVVMPDGETHRPGIVVDPGANGFATITLFTDGINDGITVTQSQIRQLHGIPYDGDKNPGTWHWIERS